MTSRTIVAAVCAICVVGIGSTASADDQQPSDSQQQKPSTEINRDAFCALSGVPDKTPCPKGCKDGACQGTCQAGFCTPPPPP